MHNHYIIEISFFVRWWTDGQSESNLKCVLVPVVSSWRSVAQRMLCFWYKCCELLAPSLSTRASETCQTRSGSISVIQNETPVVRSERCALEKKMFRRVYLLKLLTDVDCAKDCIEFTQDSSGRRWIEEAWVLKF